jgi:DNA-binding transcriptional regulator GbsR (MarR family)
MKYLSKLGETMLLDEFSRELRGRSLSFLWRQWAQLGLASANVEHRDGWIIDPESLLLITCTAGRWDPRLFDETLDWVMKNCRFLNIPRLKSLIKKHHFHNERIFGALASTVASRNKRLNWRFPYPELESDAVPLFYDQNGDPIQGFGTLDEIFLSFGYQRGAIQLRGLSRRFNPVTPETSLLRLRSLLGISARVEILLYLLTHKTGHPSGIARDTGYSQKNVQDTLVDMSATEIVGVAALRGRKKDYFIREKDRSPFLHNLKKPPRWITWPPLLSALEKLLISLDTMSRKKQSSLLLSSNLRQLMKEITPNVELAGFGEYLSDPSIFSGDSYTQIFFMDVLRLFEALNTPRG